jgi:hypothetical protein
MQFFVTEQTGPMPQPQLPGIVQLSALLPQLMHWLAVPPSAGQW